MPAPPSPGPWMWWQSLECCDEISQFFPTCYNHLLLQQGPGANIHFGVTKSLVSGAKVTFLSVTWLAVMCDKTLWNLSGEVCEGKKKEKMFLDEKLLAVVMLLAYHYIQLADHTVRLDDPVDRLGALEQQDDVTMQEGIILQRPQLHYDIHLESTAGKKNFGWLGLCCIIMPSVSGQLINRLDAFPEKMQTYADHTDQIAIEWDTAQLPTFPDLWSFGCTE